MLSLPIPMPRSMSVAIGIKELYGDIILTKGRTPVLPALIQQDVSSASLGKKNNYPDELFPRIWEVACRGILIVQIFHLIKLDIIGRSWYTA